MNLLQNFERAVSSLLTNDFCKVSSRVISSVSWLSNDRRCCAEYKPMLNSRGDTKHSPARAPGLGAQTPAGNNRICQTVTCTESQFLDAEPRTALSYPVLPLSEFYRMIL